jgi:hypothetical protein
MLLKPPIASNCSAYIKPWLPASCHLAAAKSEAWQGAPIVVVDIHSSFDLTAAFTNDSKPYLTSLSPNQAYVFYVTAIMPGLNNVMTLP